MDIGVVIRRLIPRNTFGASFLVVLNAIAGAVQGAFNAARSILKESNPGTADSSLQEWYRQLAIKYDPGLPVEVLQKEARQRAVAMGSQTLDSIRDTLQIAFPYLEVEAHTPDLSPVQYRVYGEITDESQIKKFQGLIRRIGPAEMEPLFDPIVIIKSLADTDGVLVLDTAGEEIIGRTYVEED